jgi:hypothetical protein
VGKKKKRILLKVPRPKRRVPVAPPQTRHSSAKDYDRKEARRLVQDLKKSLSFQGSDDTE